MRKIKDSYSYLFYGLNGSSYYTGDYFDLDINKLVKNDFSGNDIIVIPIPYEASLPAYAISPQSFGYLDTVNTSEVTIVSALKFRFKSRMYKVKQFAITYDRDKLFEEELIKTDADLFKGTSGSPIYVTENDSLSIAGLVSRRTNKKLCNNYQPNITCYNLISLVTYDTILKEIEHQNSILTKVKRKT